MAEFYSNVFGWPYKHFEEMSYTTAETGDGSVGVGYNPIKDSTPAGMVTVYIHTDDLADSLNKVKAHGGEVLDSFPVPTVGLLGFFRDPTGNLMGLLQPEPGSTG
jgi:predicted enzyme related to lactoylglutathione lyase